MKPSDSKQAKVCGTKYGVKIQGGDMIKGSEKIKAGDMEQDKDYIKKQIKGV